MKHYEVEGLVFRLTNMQEKELERLFPLEQRMKDDKVRSSALNWIMANGKFMFNIYFV